MSKNNERMKGGGKRKGRRGLALKWSETGRKWSSSGKRRRRGRSELGWAAGDGYNMVRIRKYQFLSPPTPPSVHVCARAAPDPDFFLLTIDDRRQRFPSLSD